jgi:PAS domain S-box-containing protein
MDEAKISTDRPERNEPVQELKGMPRISIGAQLAVVALVMLIGMGGLEWLLQVVHPAGTWGRHLAAIIGASLLATVIVYLMVRKNDSYLREANTEISTTRQLQAELEQKVAELAEELVGATKQLREEMEERRKIEDALQETKNDLKSRLDKGSAEITSANQKLTEELNELKKAYGRLKRSEKKFRNLLNTIEDGYYEVDLEGNLIFFNNALCTIAGLSRERLTGMNNRDYTNPETAHKMYQVFNKVYRTGESAKEFDWEIIRTDGSKRYVEASVSLIKDSKGQGVGFRGIVRDITERKQAEEKLKSLLYSFGQAWTK